jgi:N-acetylglucosaminyldiphosphoundecaprenol N-acetyl-beta-D-mannosaminyltransferase
MGLPFDAMTLGQATNEIRRCISEGERCFLSTPNLNFLAGSRTDQAFRGSVLRSQLSVADGAPLVWTARLLGIPLPERVAGSDIFESLRASPSRPAITVYFFGGPPGAAEAACGRLNAQGAGVRCVGHASPGFGTIEDMSSADTIRHINASNADMLIVALGAKKGQAWIERNLAALNPPIVSHLGAVVNFVAGSVSRAPVWAQRLGLEWVWRIKEEPNLWRRYYNDGKAFIGMLRSMVIPTWWAQRSVTARNLAPEACVVEISTTLTRMVLHGDWDRRNLSKFQNACAATASRSTDIVVDLNDWRSGDSAFFGTLLLLAGHQSRQGHDLAFEGTHAFARTAFERHGIAYLLESMRPAG